MDTTTSASNIDTWRPSWERDPEFSNLLRPYSTAKVVYDGTRPRPELWDICNGCILWLPPKQDVHEDVHEILDSKLSIRPPGFFDHPILVLKIDIKGPQDATVHFVTMTSLRKRSLEKRHSYFRDHYLPIFPAAPHPTNGLLLHLENKRPNRGMVVNSYVSTNGDVFSLDYRAVRCYSAGQKADGYRHRLRKESFDQVTRELGYSSSAWIETGELWEEYIRKYVPGEVEKAFDSGV